MIHADTAQWYLRSQLRWVPPASTTRAAHASLVLASSRVTGVCAGRRGVGRGGGGVIEGDGECVGPRVFRVSSMRREDDDGLCQLESRAECADDVKLRLDEERLVESAQQPDSQPVPHRQYHV